MLAHLASRRLPKVPAHPWPYCSMLSGTSDVVRLLAKSSRESNSRAASVRLIVPYAVAGSGAGSAGGATCSWSWNTVRRPWTSAEHTQITVLAVLMC